MKRLEPYANLSVSERSLTDPYCLLHECQGNLLKTIEAGAILDQTSFIRHSVFCEWAYFINLDAGTFEVYKGFQKEAHQRGRFAGAAGDGGYYPCALIAEFPLDNIPEDWMQRVEPQE
jgi:hypothetical protein